MSELSHAPDLGAAPPQNLDAEESVLGSLLVSESMMEPVLVDVQLSGDDFYRERHRIIFNAIRTLHERNDPVDSLTVSEYLKQTGELAEAGSREAIQSLAINVPVPGNGRKYAEIVKQNSLLRRLLRAAQEIQQSVHERGAEPRDLVDQAESLLFRVAHEERASDFKVLPEILSSELHRLEQLAKGELSMTGTPSGFTHLDKITGGFQPGNLVVIAARPGMGKSALVANVAENVAMKTGKAVAFFSMEMSEAELAHRFIACRARIPGERLRMGKVSERDWPRVLRACGQLEQAPLWIDDSSDLGMLELRAKARRLATSEGELGLIILDYIQLMRAEDPRQNRVEQVAQMSRGLKNLARELKVPVLALSQLSRAPEQRPDKRPMLSDLRESGQIEQDSDVVAFIYRDDYYNEDSQDAGTAELIIAKHRNGPTGKVRLAFAPEYPSFYDIQGGTGPAVDATPVPSASAGDEDEPADAASGA